MKHILITLLTFFTLANKALAQFKLEILPSDSKYAKMQIDCADQAECDSKLLDWINKQKFFKGSWNDDAIGSIVSKQEIDLEENEVTKYFHPSNFSIEQKDISAELAEQALEQAIQQKINCGESAVKYIAKNNVKKQLTKAQRKQMIKTYADILDQLKAGAVDIAKEDIQSVQADGIIVTDEDKTSIINFLTECE